jgi:ABC transporter with metal-binding/Fe-S-binding domain ATP-binding protein
MFHYPGTRWTRLQAEAMGLPLFDFESQARNLDEELADLRVALQTLMHRYRITGVLTGTVASDFQKRRIDILCDELGLKSFSPLWRKDPLLIVEEELALGLDFIMTSCMALGLGEHWLGRRLDSDAISELKSLRDRYGLNIAFEGGEAETFVFDAPIFNKRIIIASSSKHWKGDSGYLEIEKAYLEEKRVARPPP